MKFQELEIRLRSSQSNHFLRNSHISLWWLFAQILAKCFGATFEVPEDASAISVFVMRCAGIFVGHAVSQGIVKQNSDLAGRRSDRFGLARPCCQSSINSTASGIAEPNRKRAAARLEDLCVREDRALPQDILLPGARQSNDVIWHLAQ